MASVLNTDYRHARQIVPQWNSGLVAASIAVSFLGAFTSTQLMVQARTSRYLSGVLVWITLSSLVFGFCSIWCLHFIGMLACEMDLPIGLNAPLTVLSALLAVVLTWLALATGLLLERYKRSQKKKNAAVRRENRRNASNADIMPLTEPWVGNEPFRAPSPIKIQEERNETSLSPSTSPPHLNDSVIFDARNSLTTPAPLLRHSSEMSRDSASAPLLQRSLSNQGTEETSEDGTDTDRTSSEYTGSRRSSGVTSSESSFGLGKFASIRTIKNNTFGTTNPFKFTVLAIWAGLTFNNIGKGFVWSLAITSMHYVGIIALKVPNGYCKLDVIWVLVSALISWVVCVVGCILMASMELRLGQQLLFSVIATTGVAAMHFTGMRAADFRTTAPPSDDRGYPKGLAVAIVSIAITTCLAANFLLAHSATVARDKLAEVVHTRKKLWAAIAQKENAEAAALARSDFIATASHEIRTPLFQLQGYSDLLARTKLSEESRLLLYAIQDATRSLSLITSNVLDWSRLEKGEATCRPTALDLRAVCESVLNLLPGKDEDDEVELLIAVSPKVPKSLFIDETYLRRIIMNLLSNALKFTTSGYVLLGIEMQDLNLVATVTDTGTGIPETFLPELFEPFKQAQTRGAQRGTGLGLSIVIQLLEKMRGTIRTESKHRDSHPEESGTTFTVTFPVQIATEAEPTTKQPHGRIAMFGHPGSRTLDGVRAAWTTFGVEAVQVETYANLSEGFQYAWANLNYLRDNPALLRQFRDQNRHIVMIPYDDERRLYELLGSSPPVHFLPVRIPLIWHQIVETLAKSGDKPTRPDPASRTVRFASVVDVLDGTNSDKLPGKNGNSSQQGSTPLPSSVPSPRTVMLVEDNKINQRLGIKMLKTLGYDVIVANDGQEAIELLQEHDSEVDAILMDQNMPRKDGLTATKEIREMEAYGTVKLKGGKPRPIIAVTAVVGAHAEAMCKQVGTDAFLPKPLSLAKLRDTLELYLRQSDDEEDQENGLV